MQAKDVQYFEIFQTQSKFLFFELLKMALYTKNYSLDNENFHSFQITQLKDFMIGGKFKNKYKILEKLDEDDQGVEYKIASNENSEIKV